MIGYEIKKIFAKTSYKISLGLLLIVTLVISWLAIGYVDYMDENAAHHTGFSAAAKMRELKGQWEGPITEEVLCRVIRENAAVNATPEANSDDVHQQNIAYARKQGYQDIRTMITQAFCPFREYNYYLPDSLSESDMTRFYEGRTSSLRTWLYSDDAIDRFTEAERTFLLTRYRELETPYYYAYSDGWEATLEYASSIIMITMLFIAFYVSSIFSGETQTKADAIFFSTKLGRSSAVRAKVWAGFLVTTVTYWAAVLLFSVIVFTVLGLGGATCPIQIWMGGWKSFYHLNFIQMYLLTFIGGWIGTLSITAISMAISAKTRSSVLAVSVPFIILFLPSFLGEIDGLADYLALLPEQLLSIGQIVSAFHIYTIGDTVIGSVPILFVVYSALYMLLLPLMYGVYRRTQLV